MKANPKEIPFKEWLADEAKRCGVTPEAIAWRVKRGKYPGLKIRCVNKRVVFVRLNEIHPTIT